MLDVLSAAEDVKALVAQQGVDAWVDSRRHYKPGQKFAHWEFRGVMLRVEVGPEDLAAGVCRVCRSTTPGDYLTVEKKRVKLPPAGGRSLLLALKEWGLTQIEVERRDGDSAEEEDAADGVVERVAVKPPKGKVIAASTGSKEADEDEDLAGNWAPRVAQKAEKKFKHGAKTHGKK